jgi:hypothetical protein
MKDPRGMISATKIFKNEIKSIFYKNKILAKLFTAHPHFDERIQMAQQKLRSL